MKDRIRIMLFNRLNGPPKEVETTEEELHLMVMLGYWSRNAYLDQASDNPKRLPAFERTGKADTR